MVNGKDHLPVVVEKWSKLGRTTRLLMRMLCYFTLRRYVILDSWLCVLKALIELKKVSLFVCTVI